MFARAWHRHRLANKKTKCLRAITRLNYRATIRDAEQVVSAAWIEHVCTADTSDPLVHREVERELKSHAEAARARSADSARDLQRLAAISAQVAEPTQEADHNAG